MDNGEKLMEQFMDFGSISYEYENKLLQCMQNNNLSSVSAPEIGLNKPIMALKQHEMGSFIVAFNPKVVYTSDEKVAYYETCFSYPQLKVRIERPVAIRVRYQDVNGNVVTRSLMGYDALRFQHEMIHMNENSKPFYHDANFLNKMKAIKDWKVISRKLKREAKYNV
jgi:peptide deformylase